MATPILDPMNLFENIGIKKRFKPKEIQQKFIEYVQSLIDNPIELEERVQRLSSSGNKTGTRNITLRCAPPRITDFVIRWLGMSMNWWSNIDKGSNGRHYKETKARITEYIYNCKLNGAYIGAYNANIVARDIGLRDGVDVEQRNIHKYDLNNLSDEQLEALASIKGGLDAENQE